MNSVMRAYIPVGADPLAITSLMLSHGGYVCWDGHMSRLNICLSFGPVKVYECATTVPISKAVQQLEHAARTFLRDNKTLDSFHGVVLGDGVKKIKVTSDS